MLSAEKRIKNACAGGRMMHACLITGVDSEAASRLADECASILLFGSENVDALKLSADYFDVDGSIKMDDFRELRRELHKQTFGGKNRVVSVRGAHLLNANVINAMLKLLEEPPEGTYFLLTGAEQLILPTIRSRCAVVRLEYASSASVREKLMSLGASASDAAAFAALGMGSESRAVRLYSDESFRGLEERAVEAMLDMLAGRLPFAWAKSIGRDRNAARESIEFMLELCRDMLLLANGMPPNTVLKARGRLRDIASGFTTRRICGIINKLTDAEMRLGTNAGPNLILDGMIADIAGA